MHSILKEIHPSTVIDHALRCNFFNDDEVNLVTAGSSRITVYRLYTTDEGPAVKNEVPSLSTTIDSKAKQKLEQVASYCLFGNVINMQSVRLGNNVRDSILLAFKDAKLSIVEYDPANHDLKTDSMHFFENEEFKGGLSQNIHDPLVRVDPENRCACLLIYGHHLVILPFKHIISKLEDHSSEGEHIKSVLPSYMIHLQSLDQPVSNVADLQFLHGYQEPTLMLLYEPVQTSSGRIAVRQDTYCTVSISLNMSEKVHPIIWSVTNLPFDSQMIRAIQKPLGGVLVFASNSLIYLNQSTPPYGVSLNSISEPSTMFPLKNQENVVITLAEASCDFLSADKLVLSLKAGEIYVLTLITDGLRTVRSFHFDKAAGSVLASCVCCIEEGFLFLGSRLGNSLLLRYTEKTDGIIPGVALKPEPGEPPLQKKRKTQTTDELDDLEIFGDSAESGVEELQTYSFDVSDSILNIGPITNAAVGEPAFQSEEFSGRRQIDVEMVCCSGYGKNGALSIMQRSIRPQVVTTFELPGCTNMWTVFSNRKEKGKEHYHTYLILSREDSTMVLKTGDEITEIDNSGFYAQYPTVYAGNLGLNKYIVQVCPMNIRLLEGTTELQDKSINSGSSPITFCSFADPHGVLLTLDGNIIYTHLVEDFNGAKLKLLKPNIHKNCKITSVCVYKDYSGLFTIGTQHEERQSMRTKKMPSTTSVLNTAISRQESRKSVTIEDEEEMLYGGSNLELENAAQQEQLANIRRASFAFHGPSHTKYSTYWCLLCRENGSLEIYSLPDFELVFVCNNFENAVKVLIDNGNIQEKCASENTTPVKEILMVGVGHKQRRPFLFTLIDQDLVIYECFHFSKHVNNHLTVRFKRLENTALMRIKEEIKFAEMVDAVDRKIKVPQLRVVHNVSTYETGIFVCGAYPHWFFVTSRGVINGHPLTVDDAVTSFASFNNVNCPNGFFYFNKQGELRIAVLPTHLTYDSPWPVRKVPLRMTPYHISYLPDAKVYAVALSYNENQKKLPKFHTEEREFDTVERDSRYIYSNIDRFIMQLISPVSWEVIPNTRTVLHEFEHVTCMQVLHLQCEMVESGLKQFLVVGTTYNFGEDLACKGRILIFDIIEVVPEPGQPLTKTKSKCLYNKEQKGPVSAVCASSGYLMAAVGQKIYAYSFKNNDLVGVAFVDSQVFTVSMIALRNIIVATDISRSISLIRFQVNHKSLALVSRDSKPLEGYTSEFYIDGPHIGFIVSDAEQNLVIFAYQPEALESFGGHRLLKKADINVASHINTMFRVRVAQDEPGINKIPDQRHVTYMPTLDGSINLILPLPEKSYRRLLMLQNKLVECLQHKAGLNPRAYRALHTPIRPLTNPYKNILDNQLLTKYVDLSFQERFEIAKKMGTTPTQILDDMMDIERATAQF